MYGIELMVGFASVAVLALLVWLIGDRFKY